MHKVVLLVALPGRRCLHAVPRHVCHQGAEGPSPRVVEEWVIFSNTSKTVVKLSLEPGC